MSTDTFSPAVFPRLGGADLSAQREQARVRGYAEGHAEGFRAGSAAAAAAAEQVEAERSARDADAARAVDDALSMLHAAARSLSQHEQELSAGPEERVLARALELAEFILVAELTDAGASAAAALRRALAAADVSKIREVRLHPDDLQTLEQQDARSAAFAFVADETLARGDAVATLDHGFVDARIGAALERARRAVAEGTAVDGTASEGTASGGAA